MAGPIVPIVRAVSTLAKAAKTLTKKKASSKPKKSVYQKDRAAKVKAAKEEKAFANATNNYKPRKFSKEDMDMRQAAFEKRIGKVLKDRGLIK